ncbi:Uncharacterised protein [Candidatus Burarchaeum australiense]|nr:Uncharacterised protein [Candidatus Burarchaeum australiense]
MAQKGKDPEMKTAIEELRKFYEAKREEIKERHTRVVVTPGSKVDQAVQDYERRERVAKDIGKDKIKKTEEGDETGEKSQ